MALWNGSVINSTETAKVFNQLANLKSIAIVRKKNALLYKLIGKVEPNSLAKGFAKFERSSKITGKNIEVGLLGTLATTTKVADGAEELQSVSLAYDPSAFGAAEFPLTHYTLPYGIPASELDRYKGQEKKTASYLDDVMQRIMLSYENDMGTDLHSTSAGQVIGRKTFGSWLFGVSDGGASGSGETANAYRYYGTIDRQDAANADFRGIVAPSVGTWNLSTLRTYKNQADANGGTTDTIVLGTSNYTKAEGLVEAYQIVTDAKDMVDFGGQYFRYSGMDFMHDQRCPATTIGGLDSSSWLYVDNHEDFTSAGVIKDPTRMAAYVIPSQRWAQLICRKPNSNFKLLGAS